MTFASAASTAADSRSPRYSAPSSRPSASHPYYSRVLAGIMSALEGRDIQMRIQAVGETDVAGLEAIAERVSLGAVLASVPADLAVRFQRRCRRVVSLVETAASVPAVEADNFGGGYGAVTYLHQLGRRRIAAIHGPNGISCGVNRRAGYLQAVADCGWRIGVRAVDSPARAGSTRRAGCWSGIRT